MSYDMVLEMKEISKVFGEVEVLNGIGFSLDAGQLLGLIGENGAGKSTLMNILGGVFEPSTGEMHIDKVLYAPFSPKEALEAGIAFIHQELNLFPNLTIAENLLINDFPSKKVLGCSLIDKKRADQKTKKLLTRIGLDLPPRKKVEELSTAHQQMVEIAKALSINPRVIIFDEPTTSLTRQETDQLFELIINLKKEGIAMIYISHNLEDVMQLADDIAVLRDGALISYAPKSNYTKATMVNQMVGRSLDQYFPSRRIAPSDANCLKVEKLSNGTVDDVSFVVKKNEVVGFYGLVGAGRSELARALYGLDPILSGGIIFEEKLVHSPKPSEWIKQGVGFLTENRREEGLMLKQTLEKNAQLAVLPKFKGLGNILAYERIKAMTSQKIHEAKVKCNDLNHQHVSTLSGGNQQKIVLAKWLLIQPQLLILDEPTKGIDIGAKHEIYTLINQLVEVGSGIMMISSEIEELLGLCDRILVMSHGRITKEFSKETFDRSAILEAALHLPEGEGSKG